MSRMRAPSQTKRLLMQRTLRQQIACAGVGLHSGVEATLRLVPAPAGHGIRFRRTDLPGGPVEFAALWSSAVETPLNTTLRCGDTEVRTIEHLMSALAGCGIDNALIEIDGPEVPIMDGSAAPFVFLIESAGIVTLDAPRRAIRIVEPVEVIEADRHARLGPVNEDGFSVDFEIDFDQKVIAQQRLSLKITGESFKREIARARTFGFLEEVHTLRKQGLCRGGSLDNAIVVSGERILNEGGLRFENEFVRHKVLDSIGDLYLAGAPIIGRFVASRAGHALNLRLLRSLFSRPTAWRWTTLTDSDAAGLDLEEEALAIYA